MNSGYVLLIGIAILGLFLWYFGAESWRLKRIAGLALTILIVATSITFYQKLGVKKGIELQGGFAVGLQIVVPEGRSISPDAQDQVIRVLERRLNQYGTEDLQISPQGNDRIFIQIPGVGEEAVKSIIELITKNAKLDFSLIHEENDSLVRAVLSGDQVVPGWRALPMASEGPDDQRPASERLHYLVKARPDMSGKHVTSASFGFGEDGWEVHVDFDSEGSDIFGKLSTNYGRQMAIILDDEIVSAPFFSSNQPIYGGVRISGGNFTQESAQSLANALENPLENPVKVISSSQISPTMGEDTVNQGILAGISGLAATLLFIVIYYRFSGMLAMVGLTINLIVIFGALALFKFTLTLPGIAGIILTIGMAIDANVLIYERLREELAAGKSLRSALDAAYDKALSAIVDANITTLITGFILFYVATGTVKGFAVTLIIGVVASMFTALMVTRMTFSWATDTGPGLVKKLSFMNMSPKRQFDFLSRRRVCMVVSAIAVVVSLIVVPLMDPRGVDLKEGDFLTIRSDADLSVAKIEDALKSMDFEVKPIVQEQSPIGADGKFYTIRANFERGPDIKEHLEKTLGLDLASTEIDSVGAAVGSEMLRTSVIALAISLFAILLYVTIRFEFSFALGAIVALFHDLIVLLGIQTLLGQEVSLITVGAFLTIAGYSINDTIVVFDRVREGLRSKRGEVRDIMNYSINATLSRTILTGVTTLLTVVTLYLFGGPALSGFALTIILGVLIGTYSSIFVAAPIVLWWARRSGTNLRREVLDADQAKIGPSAAQQA